MVLNVSLQSSNSQEFFALKISSLRWNNSPLTLNKNVWQKDTWKYDIVFSII